MYFFFLAIFRSRGIIVLLLHEKLIFCVYISNSPSLDLSLWGEWSRVNECYQRWWAKWGPLISYSELAQSMCQSAHAFKSFCLRDRRRLGNRGRPTWLKFGTLSYYGDLCNMPKFQLHCSYLGWVLDGTLSGVPQWFFYSPFWALFNTLITMSGIF